MYSFLSNSKLNALQIIHQKCLFFDYPCKQFLQLRTRKYPFSKKNMNYIMPKRMAIFGIDVLLMDGIFHFLDWTIKLKFEISIFSTHKHAQYWFYKRLLTNQNLLDDKCVKWETFKKFLHIGKTLLILNQRKSGISYSSSSMPFLLNTPYL